MLGRGVGGDVGIALLPRCAGDVDDAAPAGVEHIGQRGLRAQEATGEVHRQHPLPELDRGLEKRRALGGAGIVDEDDDRAARSACLREGRLHALRVRHVGSSHAMAAAGERIGHALQCFAVASQQGQHGALGGQGAGDLCADAACSASDECMAASE
jgi:hypothetical protein